ncbi:hydrogenase 4 subunit B [Desulfothermus okinawensis JCM 13304]
MSIIIYVIIAISGKERPGYIMLAISEAGTIAVLIAFVLLSNKAGSTDFTLIKLSYKNIPSNLRGWIFFLSFIGFGIKAGILPLNFWLPRAYKACDRSLIPLVAGVSLNLGIYGIIKVNLDLLPINNLIPAIIVLITGAITAIIGILYATIEDDLKAVLAHSSIENAGIITTGLGAGFVFLILNLKAYAAMAFVVSFYHILNHSIFKTLLFMGQSEVEEKITTSSLDNMGGLLKKMPYVGSLILIGVLSISGLPPFNGFVSEWLTLEVLLRSVEITSSGVKLAFVFSGVLLALTAGLAVSCFVRAFAMGFLGMPRSKNIGNISEGNRSSLISMAILGAFCLGLGILPTYVIPSLDNVVFNFSGVKSEDSLIPPFFNNFKVKGPSHLSRSFIEDFHNIGAQIGKNILPGRGLVIMHRGGTQNPVVFAASPAYTLITILAIIGITMIFVWFFFSRKRKLEYLPRWDGGISNFCPEMTYTATGFSQPVMVIFNSLLRPRVVEKQKNIGGFQLEIKREKIQLHLIDRYVFYPLINVPTWLARKIAKIHSGEVTTYTTYVFLALLVIVGLCWF